MYEMIDNFEHVMEPGTRSPSEQVQEFCSGYSYSSSLSQDQFLGKPEERISELFRVIRCLQHGRDPKLLNSVQDGDE